MRWLIRLAVLLGVLAVLLYVGDRLAARAASDRIATAVQHDAHLAKPPTVTVHGFPFLLQAARGRYDRIDVVADDVFQHGGGGDGSVVALQFRGVHVPPSKAISGQVHSIPVDRVVGSVALSFADVEAAAHVPGLGVSAVPGHPDQVALTEQVSVAGLSAQARVTAHLSVSGHQLTVSPTDVSVAGVSVLPPALLDSVKAHAAFSFAIPGLPSAVALTGVSVGPAHVDVQVDATHIVLTR